MIVNRRWLITALALVSISSAWAQDDPWQLFTQESDAVVLFRHANAPGTGDPAGFVLGDCSTQRNLDDKGRAEARAIGAAFRERDVLVGRVVSSQWCRSRETADLAFPGRVEEEPCFNSFFSNREAEGQATAAALGIIGAWKGPGVLVAVTHQVNITALTGIVPRPGEGIIVTMEPSGLKVLGRLPPPAL